MAENDTVAIIEVKSDLSLVVKDLDGKKVRGVALKELFKKELITLDLRSPGVTLMKTRSSEIIRVIIDGKAYCFVYEGGTMKAVACT
jgi:hypothetical protein